MYTRNNASQQTKKVSVPDDYSGTAFADNSTNTYEVENIATEDTEVKSIPVAEPSTPASPASKSIFSKILPKGIKTKGLGDLFCDENLIIIGLIVFFLLGCNDRDSELLIILLLLLLF